MIIFDHKLKQELAELNAEQEDHILEQAMEDMRILDGRMEELK